jgi:hypothetical protein
MPRETRPSKTKKPNKAVKPSKMMASSEAVMPNEMVQSTGDADREEVSTALLPIDGRIPLPQCTLKETLVHLYCELAAVLAGHHLPGTAAFFEEELPGIVYDVALGAGWLPFPPENLQTEPVGDPSRLHGKQVVILGDFKVERWYRDSFMALLDEWIGFHTVPADTRERRIEKLPKYTNTKTRQDMLDAYIKREVEINLKKEYLDPVTRAAPPKMTEIARRAGVDYSDFNKWRRGPKHLKDSSEKSHRISLLLLYDERQKPKSQWHRVEGESQIALTKHPQRPQT